MLVQVKVCGGRRWIRDDNPVRGRSGDRELRFGRSAREGEKRKSEAGEATESGPDHINGRRERVLKRTLRLLEDEFIGCAAAAVRIVRYGRRRAEW